MKRFSIILGLLLATVAGAGLSMFVLIGSQGMNSKTPVLPVIAAYVPMLFVAHGLAAAVGMIPVGLTKGARAWKFAVCGFAAGGAFEGLLFTMSLLTMTSDAMRFVAIATYLTSLVSPLTGGIAALVLESKTRAAA